MKLYSQLLAIFIGFLALNSLLNTGFYLYFIHFKNKQKIPRLNIAFIEPTRWRVYSLFFYWRHLFWVWGIGLANFGNFLQRENFLCWEFYFKQLILHATFVCLYKIRRFVEENFYKNWSNQTQTDINFGLLF